MPSAANASCPKASLVKVKEIWNMLTALWSILHSSLSCSKLICKQCTCFRTFDITNFWITWPCSIPPSAVYTQKPQITHEMASTKTWLFFRIKYVELCQPNIPNTIGTLVHVQTTTWKQSDWNKRTTNRSNVPADTTCGQQWVYYDKRMHRVEQHTKCKQTLGTQSDRQGMYMCLCQTSVAHSQSHTETLSYAALNVFLG